jgi:hypothetical protein
MPFALRRTEKGLLVPIAAANGEFLARKDAQCRIVREQRVDEFIGSGFREIGKLTFLR